MAKSENKYERWSQIRRIIITNGHPSLQSHGDCTFLQAKVSVSSEKFGLTVMEPLLYAHDCWKFTNGIADVSSNKPFCLFVRNVGESERSLTKKIVIYTATKSPRSLSEVPK